MAETQTVSTWEREDDDDVNRMHSGVAQKGQSNQEWEEMQSRTFVKWINHHLAEREMSIENLIPDLCDGIKLINLVEILSGNKAGRYFKKCMSRIQNFNNCDVLLKLLKKEEVKLVNVGANDIVDATTTSIMGLIWSLISKYAARLNRVDMIAWIQNMTANAGVPCHNLTMAFNDGRLACAIVESVKPGTIDLDSLSDNGLENNKLALAKGEEVGIPAIISPEDLSNPNVDELSVMTYVAGAYTLKPAGPDAPPRGQAYTDGLYVEVVSAPRSKVDYLEADGNERTLQYTPELEGAFKLEIRWKGQMITAQPIVIQTDSKPKARHTML
eukprot:m.198327 g.198327  ORF g.198327 m.198327 type:complete len:328 (-) comp17040_c0_seq4:21-1004(-)